MLVSVVLSCMFMSVAQQKPGKSAELLKPAELGSVYQNPSYGFRYKIPYGWVDRTREMQGANEHGKGEVLLAIFERPPQAEGETVNSAVVIASESAASYAGLKRAEDYLAPLTELTASKGFKAEGEPQSLSIDTREVVRADFSKPLTGKLTMHQSTLVLLEKGHIVSFTFLAGENNEIDDLIQRLTFAAARLQRR